MASCSFFLRTTYGGLKNRLPAEVGHDLFPHAGRYLRERGDLCPDLPSGQAFCKCGPAGRDDGAAVRSSYDLGKCISEIIWNDISAQADDPSLRGASGLRPQGEDQLPER